MQEKVQVCPCAESSEEERLSYLDQILDSYHKIEGALIPVLQIAQNLFGFLPENVLKKISLRLDKPYSEVAGVVSFYSFFSTIPRGKHLVRVCLGTACYVRGGAKILDAVKKNLGIDVGQTTGDGYFSLDVARCFGACGLAPVITVDNQVHHRVNPTRIDQILNECRHRDTLAAKSR
jgi:NADH:ubiquinone oxidoreductase subunit E